MAGMKPKGSWKKDRQKKRKFIARALKWTEASMRAIAKRASVQPETVQMVNIQTLTGLPIRDAERIGEAARKATQKIKRAKRKKINFFTTEQKLRLLEQNKRALFEVALKWFNRKDYVARLLKKEFLSPRELVDGMKSYLFESLDYYDPEIIGREGKKAKPLTYIYRGAELFCMSLSDTLARTTAKKRKKPAEKKQEAWIPQAIKRLLRKIGNIPELYRGAENIGDIIERMKKIVENKEIGLTERMQQALKLSLELKKLGERKRIMGISKNRVLQLEDIAVKKIREYFSKQ